MTPSFNGSSGLTRRDLLKTSLAGGLLGVSGLAVWKWLDFPRLTAHTFIGRAGSYDEDLVTLMLAGLAALQIGTREIRGKRILLKPNLVETRREVEHVNTHPHVIRAAAEAFLHLGASSVLVGEGPGHRRDAFDILEESGLADLLQEDAIPFKNLNEMQGFTVRNVGQQTSLASLTFPSLIREIDWIVSMPKLKTHHWAGVTLSMKNLFGIMPGMYYGWPKNVLHHVGIQESILDITATLNPHFAIVDGIIGMEGDGPIMGSPKHAGVLVMGRNLTAVDATCARLMGIDPHHVGYLATASNWLGPIHESAIHQRGEPIKAVRQSFSLVDRIPAHRRLRLSSAVPRQQTWPS